MGGVVVVAAGAGVHGGHEHEVAWDGGGVFCAADGDLPVFERLAHGFEGSSREFGQLVEKEHSVVGQADFARLKVCASADEGHVGDGVVWRAEGALGYEACFAAQFSGHAMYLGSFQAFGKGEPWQYAGQAPCHHALSAAGAANENDVVASGSCHFEGALHVFLALHFGKVEGVVGLCGIEFSACVDDGLGERGFPVEEIYHVGQSFCSIDFNLIDDGGLAHVVVWHDEVFVSLFARLYGYGQCAAHGAYGAVESQFTDEQGFFHASCFHQVGCGKQSYGQRKVVAGTFFLHVGGGKVDGVAHLGQFKLRVCNGRAHSGGTFAHGIVGQPYEGEHGHF